MSAVFLVFMVLLVGFAGFAVGVTPFITKRNEVFAVTIPSAHYGDPELAKYRRSYVIAIGALTLLSMIATAASFYISEMVFSMVLIVAVMLPIVASFLLYLHFRKKVREMKVEQGWEAKAEDLVSADVSLTEDKGLPSMWWNLLYVPIIIATAAIGIAFYSQMPDQVPMQVDLNGTITTYANKSIALLLFVPAIQAFMAIILVFVTWSIRKSRKGIDPLHPRSSAQRSQEYARAWSIAMLIFGLVLTGSFVFMQLAMIGIVSMTTAMIVVLGSMFLILALVLWVTVRYGQMGARLENPAEDSDVIARDDDKYWKLGTLYYNPDDPAVFLPKRFGIGWTNNFARPLTWVYIGGLLLLIGVFLWFCFVIVGAPS